jgi:hypothetical protein
MRIFHNAALALAPLLLAAPLAAQQADMDPKMAMPAPAKPNSVVPAHDDHPMAHDDMLAPKVPTLLPGYGGGGFAVTTSVPRAQAFFSNGMELGAAFAHRAAEVAMTEAVRLDPQCAMCLWGQALVAGPTINFGKDEKERATLYALVQKAQPLARAHGTDRERALIAALALRYRPVGKLPARDAAYARAMQKVQAAYPQDNEIAVLTADALMVSAVREDQFDRAPLRAAMPLLEAVLARAPDHTPAIHFYIHCTEGLGEAAKAEPYADKLAGLAPRASHLIHMPSHTYYWVGRYQDAADANRRAVAIGIENAKALGLPAPEGVWKLPYHAHNVIFGLGGALMAGDSRTALDLAGPLVEQSTTKDKASPFMQLFAASGYYAITRFDPARALAIPEPKLPYLQAARHYARGEALAWQGDLAAARAERAAIPATLVTGKPDHDHEGAEEMLAIMRGVLDGRIAMAEGKPGEAAKAFAAAADVEETKSFSDFSDPPAFWYPVRRDQAAALLAAGDKAGAGTALAASLKLRPRDPAALELQAKLDPGAKPAAVAATGSYTPG